MTVVLFYHGVADRLDWATKAIGSLAKLSLLPLVSPVCSIALKNEVQPTLWSSQVYRRLYDCASLHYLYHAVADRLDWATIAIGSLANLSLCPFG